MKLSFVGCFVRRSLPVVAVAAAFAVSTISVTGTSPAGAADVVVTPVLSATATASGQPILLPRTAARVIVSTYVIGPGAKLAIHRHRYPRYAYVLQGKLRVTDTDTHRTFNYKEGDFALEVMNDWHFGENAGTTPLRLLVIDMVPKAQTKNTEP